MSLFDTYTGAFGVGMTVAQFCFGAAVGGSIPMVFFLLSKRILFGVSCLLICGLLSFVSLTASIICGLVLAVFAIAFYVYQRNRMMQVDEDTGQEWNDGTQEEPAAAKEAAENSAPGADKTGSADECWVEIAGWRHRVRRDAEGRFTVWHHVTRSDKGYGTEVNFELPKDYFAEHTLDDFYENVTERHMCVYGSKKREMEALQKAFVSLGWISD